MQLSSSTSICQTAGFEPQIVECTNSADIILAASWVPCSVLDRFVVSCPMEETVA